MSYNVYYIANTRKGLERDIEAFLLPQDAYPDLEDVFMFRGRIRRRKGLKFLGQIVTGVVNQSVGTANGASFSVTLTGTPILPGSVTITVGALTLIDQGNGTLNDSPLLDTGTINYFTGALTLAFNPALGAPTAVVANFSTIDSLPCMGLRTRELITINEEQLIAFDTQKANVFNANAVVPQFSDISFYKTTNLAFSWMGSDSQFFWSINYQNAFFVTNDNPGFHEFIITGITTGATTIITYTGGDVFVNGDIIAITNVVYVGNFNINGMTGTVIAHGAGTVTINLNTATGTVVTNENTGTAEGATFNGSLLVTPVQPSTVTIVVGSTTFTDNGSGVLVGVPGGTGTINYATGTFVLNFVPTLTSPTAVIASYTGASLKYVSGGLIHSLTRNFSGDGIRWYDGSGWVNFQPPLNAKTDGTNVSVLQTALILVSYKGRMIALNTWEGTSFGSNTNFAQRARYSEIGTVYYNNLTPNGFTGGSQPDAWRDDIVGRGGFIDAATSEQIISAEFIKDTLVVFFERSTYQLRYTGDPTIPFIWEKINTELGAESTFSIVPFDRGVYGVGNYGIITCDSVNVVRIDQIIPDEVFNIHNTNNGVKRVHGIRDYTKQLVYWTFPNAFVSTDDNVSSKFPTRVLVLNYLDNSYSFFNDSLTCFGAFQTFKDIRWVDLPIQWQSYPEPWFSGALQQDFPIIVAGNQQGYVFIFNQDSNNSPINDPSLTITGISNAVPAVVTVTNHNLQVGQVIQITGVNGMTQINTSPNANGIYQVLKVLTANTFSISFLSTVTGNFVPVDTTGFGTYTNGGKVTVINNFSIESKQFNPYEEEALEARLTYMDLFVEAADNGEFTINIFLNQDNNTIVTSDFSLTQTFTGQQKIWFRTIPNVTGQYIQYQLTLDAAQMNDPSMYDFEFILHAVMMHFQKAARFMFGVPI